MTLMHRHGQQILALSAGPGELGRGEAVLSYRAQRISVVKEGLKKASKFRNLGKAFQWEGWPRTKLVRSSVGQGWHATTEEEEEERKTGEEVGTAVHAGSPIKIVFFVALLGF